MWVSFSKPYPCLLYTSVVKTPDDRARGPSPKPQEEVTLQTLMTLINQSYRTIIEKLDKQNEELDKQFEERNEMFDKHFAKQNEWFDKLNEKIDSHHEEIIEQFMLLRTDIREDTNTWNADGSKVQKKQEE